MRHLDMGTNYYANIRKSPTLEQTERFRQACAAVVAGRATSDDYAVLRSDVDSVERLHIGKASAGWCFALHVWPYDADPGYPRSLADWMRLLLMHGTVIVDEYGERIPFHLMMEIIVCRRGAGRESNDTHACAGPHGLLRAKIGDHCVGHGEGTWDLLVGDFC